MYFSFPKGINYESHCPSMKLIYMNPDPKLNGCSVRQKYAVCMFCVTQENS